MRKTIGVWLALALVAVILAFFAGLAYESVAQDGCERTHNDLAVVVNLDDEKHASIIDHQRDAVRAGQPRYLHIVRDRALIDAHRRAALRGTPTRAGFDRDEYPPAATLEGGAGADVRYVPSFANRSAGSKQGRDLEGYCSGQPWILEP